MSYTVPSIKSITLKPPSILCALPLFITKKGTVSSSLSLRLAGGLYDMNAPLGSVGVGVGVGVGLGVGVGVGRGVGLGVGTAASHWQ